MRTIAFVNKKGGVGKSSCVMHLGIRYAQLGYRTLLVDVDPQASLSQGILGREALDLDPSDTLATLYEGMGIPLAALARAGGRDGLAIIPAHDRMMSSNAPDPWDSGAAQYALRDALAEVAGDYDLCLLDCPPHVMLCAWSALVAADGVVVPAQLEDFGIQGVAAILGTIQDVRHLANPALRLLGILPSMVDKRLAIHANYRADAAAAFGEDLFAGVVPAATDFKVAVTLRRGITEYKPRSEASKALVRVADEILARLDARCGIPADAAAKGVA